MIPFISIPIMDRHVGAARCDSPTKKQQNQRNATGALARWRWPAMYAPSDHDHPSRYRKNPSQFIYRDERSAFDQDSSSPAAMTLVTFAQLLPTTVTPVEDGTRVRTTVNRVNLPRSSLRSRQTDPAPSSPLFAFVLSLMQTCRYSGGPSSPRVSFIPICQLHNLLPPATPR